MAKQSTNAEPGRQARERQNALKSRMRQERIEGFITAVEQSLDGIVTFDMEENVLYVNRAYAAMHGYSVEEMIGRKVEDFHDLSTKERVDENDVARNQLVTRGSWVGELEHVRKDGTLFPMYHCVTLLKKKDRKSTEVVSICRDIAQQKLAHQAVQESEEKYRTLFEKASEAILIADPETGRILDANKQAERLFGRRRQEIIFMYQVELYPPHQAEYYRDVFREHVRRGQGLEEKGEILGKDGSIIPVSISTSVISIVGKQLVQYLFRDLTEEQKLSDYRERLESAKLIGKAKGILMDRYHISEKESLERLQKESRNQRKRMREIAQAVITSQSILD